MANRRNNDLRLIYEKHWPELLICFGYTALTVAVLADCLGEHLI